MNEVEKAIEGFKIDNILLFGSNSDEVIERNKLAIQALQAQSERDKMLCESCKHEPKNPTSSTLPCSMCSVAYASYFEPKEDTP